MPSNWFFLDQDLVEGSFFLLEGEEFHHAKDAMRVREGEEITLVNGKGAEAAAAIHAIEKKKILVCIQSVLEHTRKPFEFTLGISLLRSGHLDFVVEKATELGVDRLLLFPADLSERKESSSGLQRRLRAVSIAALKQSGTFFLPELVFCHSLKEACSQCGFLLWADIAPDARWLSEIEAQDTKRTALFIGPESGWSDQERKLFHESGPPICLHDTILRAETAGVVGAYACLHWLKTRV